MLEFTRGERVKVFRSNPASLQSLLCKLCPNFFNINFFRQFPVRHTTLFGMKKVGGKEMGGGGGGGGDG